MTDASDALDNPIWHALRGPQREFGTVVDDLAARYLHDVAPFAAVCDERSSDAWDALRSIVGAGGTAVVAPLPDALPDAWTVPVRMHGLQMVRDELFVADQADGRGRPDPVELLTQADVPAMVDLVGRTRPGPFLPRTSELGDYLGVRDADALVAMAGERMRITGFTEVSAVCTDAAYRGRGYAARLVAAVGARMAARGDRACLHVLADNTGAIRVYEQLGFRVRREMPFGAVTAPG